MSLKARSQWFVVVAAIGICSGIDAGIAVFAEDNHKIIQAERSFRPTEVTIGSGETLNFSNEDEFIHQIYVASPAMTFDSAEQSPGQVVKVAFPNAGDFPVRCHIHPKMKLLVHVK